MRILYKFVVSWRFWALNPVPVNVFPMRVPLNNWKSSPITAAPPLIPKWIWRETLRKFSSGLLWVLEDSVGGYQLGIIVKRPLVASTVIQEMK